MDSQKGLYKNILPAVVLALMLLAGTGLFFWQAGFFNKENQQNKPQCGKDYINLCNTENLCKDAGFYWYNNSCSIAKISEYPDYESTLSMNNLNLVENFESYTPNSQILNKNVASGIILKNGKISKGYLDIVVSINNKPLTTWESIYFKAPYNIGNSNLYGGHIFRPDSLKVPPNDKTHLLFALNSIPFLSILPYSESKQPKTYDLFKILNENKEIKFLAFISSLNPAKIDSIKIYYECDKDSNSGKCSLTIK